MTTVEQWRLLAGVCQNGKLARVPCVATVLCLSGKYFNEPTNTAADIARSLACFGGNLSLWHYAMQWERWFNRFTKWLAKQPPVPAREVVQLARAAGKGGHAQ